MGLLLGSVSTFSDVVAAALTKYLWGFPAIMDQLGKMLSCFRRCGGG